jgi:hypothetical protein
MRLSKASLPWAAHRRGGHRQPSTNKANFSLQLRSDLYRFTLSRDAGTSEATWSTEAEPGPGVGTFLRQMRQLVPWQRVVVDNLP